MGFTEPSLKGLTKTSFVKIGFFLSFSNCCYPRYFLVNLGKTFVLPVLPIGVPLTPQYFLARSLDKTSPGFWMGQFLLKVKILATDLLSWRCPKFEFLFLVLAGLASMFVIASWNGRYLRKFSGFQFWQGFEILVIFLVVVFAFISIYECTISNREKWKICTSTAFLWN